MSVSPKTLAAALTPAGVKPSEWGVDPQLVCAPWAWKNLDLLARLDGPTDRQNLAKRASVATVSGAPVPIVSPIGQGVCFETASDEFEFGNISNIGDEPITMFGIFSRDTNTSANYEMLLVTSVENSGFRLAIRRDDVIFTVGSDGDYILFPSLISADVLYGVVITYSSVDSMIYAQLVDLSTGIISTESAAVGNPNTSSGNVVIVGNYPPSPRLFDGKAYLAGLARREWSLAEREWWCRDPFALLRPDLAKVMALMGADFGVAPPVTGNAPLAGMTNPIGSRNLTGGGGLAT